MIKYKWWIYTVLIGLLPFFARVGIYYLAELDDPLYVLNEIDMVAFGLVMITTNITELGDNDLYDSSWRGIRIGVSTFILLAMAMLLGVAYFADAGLLVKINKPRIKYSSLVISFLAFLFSLSIVYRPKLR